MYQNKCKTTINKKIEMNKKCKISNESKNKSDDDKHHGHKPQAATCRITRACTHQKRYRKIQAKYHKQNSFQYVVEQKKKIMVMHLIF